MPRPKKKKEVLKALMEKEGTMTTGEIADQACTSRKTAKKWVQECVDEGNVEEVRSVGNITFYDLSSTVDFSEDTEKTADQKQDSKVKITDE